jgi:hypothetical protein
MVKVMEEVRVVCKKTVGDGYMLLKEDGDEEIKKFKVNS